MADNYSFAVAVYDGPASAQAVVKRLMGLQKEKALDIREAAVFTRGSGGKISMNNQGCVGIGKGGFRGLVIGAVAVSAPLRGLVLGSLIAFGRATGVNSRRSSTRPWEPTSRPWRLLSRAPTGGPLQKQPRDIRARSS